MENEKDLLKKDLENINSTDKEGLEKFKEDAEMLGYEDIAALAQEKINALNTQVEAIVVQPAERIETIQNLGGSSEELIEKVAPVQDEIEKVQEETAEKIEKIENGENSNEAVVDEMLKGITERLPGQLAEVYGSEAYNSLVQLNETRKNEEKELFQLYDQYTKNGSSSNRRDFALGEYGEQMHHYIDDLKANNIPDTVIARFQNYTTEYKQPENKASNEFSDLFTEKINKDRWVFEKEVDAKATELFGINGEAADAFKKKAFDSYHTVLSEAQEQVIPDKTKYINTKGTYYGLPNK